MHNYYKSGSWNIICQVCGKKYKSDEIRKRWDGLLVCKDDYENRHILDFIRVPEEQIAVPYVAPEPDDQFIFVCFLINSQGIADLGTADCARADIRILNIEL